MISTLAEHFDAQVENGGTDPAAIPATVVPKKDPGIHAVSGRICALLVESQASLADSIVRGLEEHGIAVVLANSLSSARHLLAEFHSRIDAVILDSHLPDGRGEDILPEIEALSKQPGIVILSDGSKELRPEMTVYRAVVVPDTVTAVTLSAILRVAAGGYAECTLQRFARYYQLSRKESEILGRLADGISPKQIAAGSDCSLQAVYAHLGRICSKTSCGGYPEVVAKLFQFSCHGLGHRRMSDRRTEDFLR